MPDLKSFAARTRDASKIIVVDLGFLGDTVQLVPALWEIKDHYPTAALHVLASPLGGEVLKLAPCVDRVWAMPLGPPSPKWWEHWDLLRALRREHFDVAFNFSGADRTVLVTRIIGARHSLGYQGARRHFWQPWVMSEWIPRRTLPTPIYEGRREILKLAGFDIKPARFDLTVPPTDLAWAGDTVPPGALHFSLSASTPLKEWPLRHWVELAQSWLGGDTRRHIVASGSRNPREQRRLREFAGAVNDPRAAILPPDLTVARLAAALHQCDAHLGADSGVLHLAMALGLKTLSIFREYSGAADWLPQGERHRHLSAPCPCANVKEPPCAATEEARCLAGISPSATLAVLNQFLPSA